MLGQRLFSSLPNLPQSVSQPIPSGIGGEKVSTIDSAFSLNWLISIEGGGTSFGEVLKNIFCKSPKTFTVIGTTMKLVSKIILTFCKFVANFFLLQISDNVQEQNTEISDVSS